ncbi:alpha/beta hydrolase [Kitasatospora sp. NPDC048540]|uniref:alpha/beta fold hydrolase n=1 Tax=Kitasatospora sp. NPDC048540 TaxID=3155634 RepID=UPI0033F81C97
MSEITHRIVRSSSGLRMRVAEAGEGPLVLLLHGFPESWYSWRHQLTALADAGYHAVAPDQRGYGATGGPDAVDQYSILHLAGDALGLLPALGAERAVVVGHDWGAPVAWHTALLRPDLVRGVVGLSVPPFPRGDKLPTATLRHLIGDAYYMLYFQQPGPAEAELAHDLPTTFRRMFAGRARLGETGMPLVPEGGGFLDLFEDPAELPDWLTEADIDFYTAEYSAHGFARPLNWYRNLDRNWELTSAWHGARIEAPALLIVGERDLVAASPHARDALDGLHHHVPRLQEILWLPGTGHWTQQERPKEVSEALIQFVQGLDD